MVAFERADSTGKRFGNGGWQGLVVLGAGVENRDMDIDRVRAMPLNCYFLGGVFIFIYLFSPFHLLIFFMWKSESGIKKYAQKQSSVLCLSVSIAPRPTPPIQNWTSKKNKKNWARLLNCPPFTPFSLGPWGTLSPLLTPVSGPAQQPNPLTLTSGVKNNPFEISYSMS